VLPFREYGVIGGSACNRIGSSVRGLGEQVFISAAEVRSSHTVVGGEVAGSEFAIGVTVES
jgi:hypothetical protein